VKLFHEIGERAGGDTTTKRRLTSSEVGGASRKNRIPRFVRGVRPGQRDEQPADAESASLGRPRGMLNIELTAVLSGDTEDRIGFLIETVTRFRRFVMDKALRQIGATQVQWWILSCLSDPKNDGMRQTDLAKAVGVGEVALSSLIDKAEKRALVTRRRSTIDRRTIHVLTTEKGRALVKESDRVASERNELMLARVPKADVALIEDVLRAMNAQLKRMLGNDTIEPPDPRGDV